MKHPSIGAIVFLGAAISLTAQTRITFGPVRGQAGESIRLVTHSETPGGTIQQSIAGQNGSGTISVTRDRDLTWTFRDPAADGTRRGMVRVSKLATSSVAKINGKEEKTSDSSPLTGKMFAMSKAPTGDWKFELDGSLPLYRIKNEIDELSVYLKRDWYPAREVKVGDSWEFDPAWIKLIIEKDLAKAQTIGTMRLRQVRHTERKDMAIIDVTIRSTGADFKSDGSEASGTVDLSGQVVVNLSTMLDEELELKGTVVSAGSKPGESAKVTLPVRLTATKTFVRDDSMP